MCIMITSQFLPILGNARLYLHFDCEHLPINTKVHKVVSSLQIYQFTAGGLVDWQATWPITRQHSQLHERLANQLNYQQTNDWTSSLPVLLPRPLSFPPRHINKTMNSADLTPASGPPGKITIKRVARPPSCAIPLPPRACGTAAVALAEKSIAYND